MKNIISILDNNVKQDVSKWEKFNFRLDYDFLESNFALELPKFRVDAARVLSTKVGLRIYIFIQYYLVNSIMFTDLLIKSRFL